MDVNRRLNDLLNQKDEEILQLNHQILELKLNQSEIDNKNNVSQDPTKSPHSTTKKVPVHGDKVIELFKKD